VSFDIDLLDVDGKLLVGSTTREEGGTYALGGTPDCSLNVTYNYSPFFAYRNLDGRKASETVADLCSAVATLGTEQNADYWAATRGNAGYACAILLAFAEEFPDGIWEVT